MYCNLSNKDIFYSYTCSSTQKHKEVLAKNFCYPVKISENNLTAVWWPCVNPLRMQHIVNIKSNKSDSLKLHLVVLN